MVDITLLVFAGALAYLAGRMIGNSDSTLDVWLVLGTLGIFGAVLGLLATFLPQETRSAIALMSWSLGLSVAGGYAVATHVFDRNVINSIDAGLRAVGVVGAREVADVRAPVAFLETPPIVQPIDERNFRTIVGDLEAVGIHANRLVSIHFLLDEVDQGKLPLLPVSGIANDLTVHCNEGDQYEQPLVRMDRYGFNNTDWVYASKRDRILVLGDSNVYGQCVHQEQTIAGWLRRQGWAAISLGISGNGPLVSLAALREYGAAMKPKYVFFSLFDRNDFSDFRDRELRSPSMIRYLRLGYSQGLIGRQGDVDRLWQGLFDVDGRWNGMVNDYYTRRDLWIDAGRPTDPKLLEMVNDALSPAEVATLTQDEDIVDILVAMIKSAAQEVEGWGGTFYYFSIRSVLYYRGVWHDPMIEAVTKRVQAEGIPVVDIEPLIRGSGDVDAFFPRTASEPHYNAAGYAAFGWGMIEAIAKRGD